jgi:hypothetical protein
VDDERFDRWIRGVQERISRRELGAAVGGALAALGLAESAAAKKKKKRKKPKSLPPPPPPPPPQRQCRQTFERCAPGLDTCCLRDVATVEPICINMNPLIPDNPERCCYPSGTRTTKWPNTGACCGFGWTWDEPGNWDGPGTCCVANDSPLPPGETPQHCCDSPNVTSDGRCCTPSGQPCVHPLYGRCCDGSICAGGLCP